MIVTLREFIKRVERLSDLGRAYDVFEDECTEEVRELIYEMSSPDEPEPFRFAMRRMGYVNF
jgi:hypothetical protein